MSVVAATLEREPTPASSIVPGIPAVLDGVIETALRKDPRDRYLSAEAMATALEQARAAITTGAAATAPIRHRRADALWWWQFHEIAAATIHGLMVVPAWQLVRRLPGPAGRALFFGLVAAAAVTGIIRLHLWFLSRQNPPRLEEGLKRLAPWVRWCDRGFAAGLALGAVAVATDAPGYGGLLMAFAVGSIAASHFVEPSSAEQAIEALHGERPAAPTRRS
jgi:hypothetical protein